MAPGSGLFSMTVDSWRAHLREAAEVPPDCRIVHWPAATRERWHAHPEHRLVIVLQGEFEEFSGRASYVATPGTAIHRWPGQLHRDAYAGSGCYLRTTFDDRLIEAVGMPANAHRTAMARSPLFRETARRVIEELRWSDAWTPLVVHGLLFELLASVGRASGRDHYPSWIDQAVELLIDESSARWTIATLAARLRVDPAEVARSFRRHVGTGVAEFARSRRLDAARDLLAHGDGSVADVALATGFYDQSHLDRAFRRAFATTPSEFRRSVRRT